MKFDARLLRKEFEQIVSKQVRAGVPYAVISIVLNKTLQNVLESEARVRDLYHAEVTLLERRLAREKRKRI